MTLKTKIKIIFIFSIPNLILTGTWFERNLKSDAKYDANIRHISPMLQYEKCFFTLSHMHLALFTEHLFVGHCPDQRILLARGTHWPEGSCGREGCSRSCSSPLGYALAADPVLGLAQFGSGIKLGSNLARICSIEARLGSGLHSWLCFSSGFDSICLRLDFAHFSLGFGSVSLEAKLVLARNSVLASSLTSPGHQYDRYPSRWPSQSRTNSQRLTRLLPGFHYRLAQKSSAYPAELWGRQIFYLKPTCMPNFLSTYNNGNFGHKLNVFCCLFLVMTLCLSWSMPPPPHTHAHSQTDGHQCWRTLTAYGKFGHENHVKRR